MSDDEKDNSQILLWSGADSAGTLYGPTFSFPYNGSRMGASGHDGSRLAYKTKELATYAGRQFASVYVLFCFGDKASGAMPWREYEQMLKSSDNK